MKNRKPMCVGQKISLLIDHKRLFTDLPYTSLEKEFVRGAEFIVEQIVQDGQHRGATRLRSVATNEVFSSEQKMFAGYWCLIVDDPDDYMVVSNSSTIKYIAAISTIINNHYDELTDDSGVEEIQLALNIIEGIARNVDWFKDHLTNRLVEITQ